MYLEMREILQAWRLKSLRHTVQIMDRLALEERTLDDLRAYLEEEKQVRIKRDLHRQKRRRKAKAKAAGAEICKVCGKAMMLSEVNSGPGDQVGGEWKSQWYCVFCDESKFSEKSLTEELERASGYKQSDPEGMADYTGPQPHE